MADERDHDLRMHVNSTLLDFRSRLKNGTSLHADDAGEDDREAASPQAHHRIGFTHTLDGVQDLLLLMELAWIVALNAQFYDLGQ